MKSREYKDEIKELVKEKLPVAIDFDATLTFGHHYPHLSEPNHPCIEVLKKWSDNGIGLILNTMRSGKELDDAIEWCKKYGVELYGIGKCPGQETWTTSPKCYAILYIDDAACTSYLKSVNGERPMIDWVKIDEVYTGWLLEMAKPYKDN